MALSLSFPTFQILFFLVPWDTIATSRYHCYLFTDSLPLPMIFYCYCQSFNISCDPLGQKPPENMIYKWKKQQCSDPCLGRTIGFYSIYYYEDSCSCTCNISATMPLEWHMQLLLCKHRKTLLTEMVSCSSNLLCTGIYLIWKRMAVIMH